MGQFTRVEGENGWFNQLENVIEARDGGTTFVRYVHSGVFTDDWDNQYDGANQHTDFYLHTLSQYLQHFSHRPVEWFSADAPQYWHRAPSRANTVRRLTAGRDGVADREHRHKFACNFSSK